MLEVTAARVDNPCLDSPGKLRHGLVKDESEDLRWRIGIGLLAAPTIATDADAEVDPVLLVPIRLRRFGLRNNWLREVGEVLLAPSPAPTTVDTSSEDLSDNRSAS